MGCNCGSSRRTTSGRYGITRTPANRRTPGKRKPVPKVSAGDFVVYRRDGTETRYADERQAVADAARNSLSVDLVTHTHTFPYKSKSQRKLLREVADQTSE